MSKKVDTKKETKETKETNEKFKQYSDKQHELINFMKENGFNITVFGAPQSYISKVSKRDTNPAHTSAYDKLSFVEEFFKNNLEDAKKEYAEEEKIVEENKKNKPRTPKEHRCNCQFCTHKQLKKPHECNCKYCTINKKTDETAEEPTEETAPAKKTKAAAKPKTETKTEPKTKAAAKPKTETNTEPKAKATTKPKANPKSKGGKTKKAEPKPDEVEEIEETN